MRRPTRAISLMTVGILALIWHFYFLREEAGKMRVASRNAFLFIFASCQIFVQLYAAHSFAQDSCSRVFSGSTQGTVLTREQSQKITSALPASKVETLSDPRRIEYVMRLIGRQFDSAQTQTFLDALHSDTRELGANKRHYASFNNRTSEQTARKVQILKNLNLPNAEIDLILNSGAVDLPPQEYSPGAIRIEEKLIAHQKLTEHEVKQLHRYTSSSYIITNSALRSGKKSKGLAQLLSGIQKLPLFIGTVYKGVALRYYEHLLNLPVGSSIEIDSIWSASLKNRVADEWLDPEQNLTLEIETSSGREIHSLSFLRNEMEIVLPPGTKFILVGRSGNNIQLVESTLHATRFSQEREVLRKKIGDIVAQISKPSAEVVNRLKNLIHADGNALTPKQKKSLQIIYATIHNKKLWRKYLEELLSLSMLGLPTDLQRQAMNEKALIELLMKRFAIRGESVKTLTTKEESDFLKALQQGPFLDEAMREDHEKHGVYTHLLQIDFVTRALHQKGVFDFDFYQFFASPVGAKYWDALFDSRAPDFTQPELLTSALTPVVDLP